MGIPFWVSRTIPLAGGPCLRIEAHDIAKAQEGVLLLDAVLQVPQRGAPGPDEVLQMQADGLGTCPRHLWRDSVVVFSDKARL